MTFLQLAVDPNPGLRSFPKTVRRRSHYDPAYDKPSPGNSEIVMAYKKCRRAAYDHQTDRHRGEWIAIPAERAYGDHADHQAPRVALRASSDRIDPPRVRRVVTQTGRRDWNKTH